jgi:3-oxoacyl-[acyl-carrier-protein] synthase II
LVVERRDHAEARGAKPLAELMGYGATCDAFHRVRPDPDMRESARAMSQAIEDAGLAPPDIEVVHYHGTGTQLNDRLETLAAKLAFGGHVAKLAGSSIKGAIGHPQGACGAAALVATIAGLNSMDDPSGGPFIPPTLNLREADPECDLDYTPNESRATTARTALVNCLAFGAKNSALVLRAAGRDH